MRVPPLSLPGSKPILVWRSSHVIVRARSLKVRGRAHPMRFRSPTASISWCAASLNPRSSSQTRKEVKDTFGSTTYFTAKAGGGQEHVARKRKTAEDVYVVVQQDPRDMVSATLRKV